MTLETNNNDGDDDDMEMAHKKKNMNTKNRATTLVRINAWNPAEHEHEKEERAPH